MSKRIIFWFRNDLRLSDNEAFWSAVSDADEILPVYVFDPRSFRVRSPGFRKTGVNRARFVVNSVSSLREQIRDLGGALMIKVGEPEKIVADLAREFEATEVRASKEITLEETNIEASLSKKLKGINVDMSLTWMSTLIHPHDLPFYISRLPERYHTFAEQVEILPVRQPVAATALTQTTWQGETFPVPELGELGFTEEELAMAGSPVPAVDIRALLYDGVAESATILNAVSSGLLSPREAFHFTTGTANGAEVYRNLLWRDYLLFLALKYGTRLFKPSGLVHQVDRVWRYDKELFFTWADGQTADPAVNDHIRTLKSTGELGFEESRVAAQYLSDVLGVNWTWGAAWFESHRVSYEVALNWGNWNYYVGVGLESQGPEAEIAL